jgi:hypothetical protein
MKIMKAMKNMKPDGDTAVALTGRLRRPYD